MSKEVQESLDEKRVIEFAKEIVRAIQQPVRTSDEQTTTSRWRWFVESNFAVALITVVVGGFFGQCITASIQKGLKEREFQQVWLKARGDQALLARKEYLDKEQESVNQTFELIGSCLAAARDLIDITDTDFALKTIQPRAREDVRKQKADAIDNYNALVDKWESGGHKMGLLMTYYHPEQPAVRTAWQDTQKSVTKHMDCARQWYKDYELKPLDTTGACKKERDEVDNHLAVLASSLEAARQYTWEGWESPEKLREILNKK